MTNRDNIRKKFENWLQRHSLAAELGPPSVLAGLGLFLGLGIGIRFGNLQDAFLAGFFGVVVGAVLGYYGGAFVITGVMAILMVFFPSRPIYPVLACLVGIVVASIQGIRLGWAAGEWSLAFLFYAILSVLALEACHSACRSIRKFWLSKK